MFASLVRDLRVLTSQDAHLDALMKEFENAVRDLRHDCSDGRIKTCIQKQVNLLEAIGRTVPGRDRHDARSDLQPGRHLAARASSRRR